MKNLKSYIDPSLVSIGELFEEKKTYVIPIYQRNYAWTKENIDALIESLMKKYRDENKNYMFLGNMEFLKENNKNLQIVDGQQRITTLLILLYQIQRKKFSKKLINELLKIKSIKRKEIKNEQDKFQDFLERPEYMPEEIRELEISKRKQLKNKKEQEFRNENIYRLNYYYIKKALERENIKDFDDFANYLLGNVYVVEILLGGKSDESGEMKLNEAIEIFNSINTTGKPLETKDIFKIRMYEYYNNNEEIFNSINELYDNIEKEDVEIAKKENEIIDEDGNKTEFSQINFITEEFSMDDILRVYKYILISKMINENKENNYKRELFRMSNSRFYDFLFKAILNKVADVKFNKFNKDCINYKELIEIFDIYKLIADRILNLKDISAEAYFNYKMLKAYTRYSWMYNFLPVLYLWKFENLNKEFEQFIANIANLFEVYSIVYSQVVNSVKNFVEDEIITKIVNSSKNNIKSARKINKSIEDKMLELKEKESWRIQRGYEILNGKIAEKRTPANIACLILAKIAEDDKTSDKEILIKNYRRLFSRKFDIEHIYAKQNKEKELSEEEVENLDRLGNLMILEYSINRKIRNKSVNEKLEGYKESKFAVVSKELELYKMSFDSRQNKKVDEVKKYLKI